MLPARQYCSSFCLKSRSGPQGISINIALPKGGLLVFNVLCILLLTPKKKTEYFNYTQIHPHHPDQTDHTDHPNYPDLPDFNLNLLILKLEFLFV